MMQQQLPSELSCLFSFQKSWVSFLFCFFVSVEARVLHAQQTKSGAAADGDNDKLQPEAVHLHAAKKDACPPAIFHRSL